MCSKLGEYYFKQRHIFGKLEVNCQIFGFLVDQHSQICARFYESADIYIYLDIALYSRCHTHGRTGGELPKVRTFGLSDKNSEYRRSLNLLTGADSSTNTKKIPKKP